MKRAWCLVGAFVVMAGCSSPEARRQRGGGPGADPGNRPPVAVMHEGSQPYWQTPVRIPANGPSLAPSEQARQLSLPSGRNEGNR